MNRLVFWGSAATIAWTLAGFPLVAWLRGRLLHRPISRRSITPHVTVIVAAFNEERVIGAKVANILGLDYPADRVECIVVSDGSADKTVDVARRSGSDEARRVVVLDLPRRGKASAITAAAARATGEILVFSDANSMLDRDALRHLVAPFADPSVGGVAGDQRYVDDPRAGKHGSERGYWSFERLLKHWESLAGSTVSATGALHAIRARYFRPVPAGHTDDFTISTSVIRQGARLVFEPRAIAREPVAETTSDEFSRKVRVATRILYTELGSRDLFDVRRHGFYAIQLASHKPMRQLMFVPLILIAAVTPSLQARGWIYRLAAVGQAIVYGLGLVGLVLGDGRVGARKWLELPAYVCMAYAAQAVAAGRVLSGRRVAMWGHTREIAMAERPASKDGGRR